MIDQTFEVINRIIFLLKRILWSCTGLGSELFHKGSQEVRNLYAGIGFSILITAVIAALACGSILNLVTGSPVLGILGGIAFGIFTYIVDRNLFLANRLASISHLKRVFAISIWLTFAIVIAVVILVPVELKLFDNEIQNQLNATTQSGRDLDTEIVRRKADIQERTLAIRQREESLQQLYNDANNEAIGKGKSGRPGRGPFYELKSRSAAKETETVNILNEIDNRAVNHNLASIQLLEEQKERGVMDRSEVLMSLNKSTVRENNDLIAKLAAFKVILSSRSEVLIVHWALTILLILLNISPILTTILTLKRVSYRGKAVKDLDIEGIDTTLELAFNRALDSSLLSPRN